MKIGRIPGYPFRFYRFEIFPNETWSFDQYGSHEGRWGGKLYGPKDPQNGVRKPYPIVEIKDVGGLFRWWVWLKLAWRRHRSITAWDRYDRGAARKARHSVRASE